MDNPLEARVQYLEQLLAKIMLSDKFLFQKPLIGGPNGLRLGSMAKDKVGFYNLAPIAQPTAIGQLNNHWAVGGTAVLDHDTFDGGYTTRYTLNDIVKNLKDLGLFLK